MQPRIARSLENNLQCYVGSWGGAIALRIRTHRVAADEKGSRLAALLTRTFRTRKLNGRHVLCLPALRSLDDVELHGLAFFETTKTVCLNSREVNENVFAILAADETKALCVIEPLNDSLFHGVTCSFVN